MCVCVFVCVMTYVNAPSLRTCSFRASLESIKEKLHSVPLVTQVRMLVHENTLYTMCNALCVLCVSEVQ